MNITLCSAFRDSTPYLSTYFNQVNALDYELHKQGHKLQMVWGEGDSIDGTLKMLSGAKFRFRATVVDCTHGGAAIGSVVSEERFKQLGYVGQCIWSAIPDNSDAVVWVESDLLWQPATLAGLIDNLEEYPAISPMVMLDRAGWGSGVNFYDTFVFRKDGTHFTHRKPYHPGYVADRPFQVDSAGSVLAMRGDIAKRIVVDERVLLGVCAQIYEMGESVWVNPTLPPVIHL